MTWQLATGYIFFLVLALWFAFSVMNYAVHRRFWKYRRYELLLIAVPLGSEVQPFATSHHLSEIGKTVELLERLHNHRIKFSFEAAVHHVGEEIHFYIYAPKKLKKKVVRDVESLFPGAKVEAGDYDVWTSGSEIEIAHVRQSKPSVIPLSCAVRPTHDAFRAVLRRLSHMRVLGEGVAVQWIIKPLSPSTKKQYVELVNSLKTGAAHSFKLLDEGFLVTPQTIGVLEEKLVSPLYSVNARIVIAHARKNEAKRLMRDLGSALGEASTGMLYNELYLVPAKKPRQSLAMFTQRAFDQKEEMVLNAQEIASIFHFPTRHSLVPKVYRG